MNNLEKLQHAFVTVMKIDPALVIDSLAYGEHPEWDSLAHMAVVAELENAFGLMLDTEEIIAMSSVAEARRILGVHGVTF
jgi:acyl carrier protein